VGPERSPASGPRDSRRRTTGFTLHASDKFNLDYILTETNVAYAIRRGATSKENRPWIDSTLWPESKSEILFPSYYALFKPYSEHVVTR